MVLYMYVSNSRELVEHLLLHYSVVFELWNFVFHPFNGFYQKKVTNLLFGQRNQIDKYFLNIWNLVLLCLMQTLKQACMCRTYKKMEVLGMQLIILFTTGSLFNWFSESLSFFTYPFVTRQIHLCFVQQSYLIKYLLKKLI